MAAFRDAESRGLDLHRALPALFQGRSVDGADDLAALLHGRVTKWLEAADDERPADLVVGLWPAAIHVTDPDMHQALDDRRTLIEQNARTLVLDALQRQDPWILRFGRPPADPPRQEEWLRRLDTIAAYRDRWQVSGHAILGAEPRTREQMVHRQAGQRAISALSDAVKSANPSGNAPEEIRGLERETR